MVHFMKIDQVFKILTCLLLIYIVLYHVILRFYMSVNLLNDSCDWLLSDGRYHGKYIWQPYGCLLKPYSKFEARNCLRSLTHEKYNSNLNTYLFIGDANLFKFFCAFLNFLHHPQSSYKKKMLNISSYLYYDKVIGIKYFFIYKPHIDEQILDIIVSLKRKYNVKLIIFNIGFWNSKFYSHFGLKNQLNDSSLHYLFNSIANKYLHGLLNISLSSDTKMIWMFQDVIEESSLYWLYKMHNYTYLQIKNQMVTNKKMLTFSKILINNIENIITETNLSDQVKIWLSPRKVSIKYLGESVNGVYTPKNAQSVNLQIFINLLCNGKFTSNFNQTPLSSDVCCSASKPLFYEPLYQIIWTFTIFLAVYLTCYTLKDEGITRLYKSTSNLIYSQVCTFAYSICSLCAIIAYLMLADKTSLFMKENKYFTNLRLFLPLIYIFVIGSFFTEPATANAKKKFNHTDTNEYNCSTKHFAMSRSKTNELKGWMQSALLIGYFTGAVIPGAQSPPEEGPQIWGSGVGAGLPRFISFTVFFDVLTNAYLILFGYTHFMDTMTLLTIPDNEPSFQQQCHSNSQLLSAQGFWARQFHLISSHVAFCVRLLKRFICKLVRYNFLTGLLCLILQRPYIFYSFVPLITFWYTIIVVFFMLPPFISNDHAYNNRPNSDIQLVTDGEQDEAIPLIEVKTKIGPSNGPYHYLNGVVNNLSNIQNQVTSFTEDESAFNESSASMFSNPQHSTAHNGGHLNPRVVVNKNLRLNLLHHFYMLTKLIFLGLFISMIYSSESSFNHLFSRFVALFHASKRSETIVEETTQLWWSIWVKDRYAVWVGMVFAYLLNLTPIFDMYFQQRRVKSSVNDSPKHQVPEINRSNLWHRYLKYVALPVFGFVSFVVFMFLSCRDAYTTEENQILRSNIDSKSSMSWDGHLTPNMSRSNFEHMITNMDDYTRAKLILRDLLSPNLSSSPFILNNGPFFLTASSKSSLHSFYQSQHGRRPNKAVLDNCFEVESYLTWIPVISYFLALMAFHDYYAGTRHNKSYSSIFSRIGKYSLELYLLQYHVWQSVPTSGSKEGPSSPEAAQASKINAGVLTFLPMYPTFNIVLVGFILFNVAHEMRNITTYVETIISRLLDYIFNILTLGKILSIPFLWVGKSCNNQINSVNCLKLIPCGSFNPRVFESLKCSNVKLYRCTTLLVTLFIIVFIFFVIYSTYVN